MTLVWPTLITKGLANQPAVIPWPLAREMWAWATLRNIFLSVEFLPGALNTEADFESRNQNPNTECH